MDTIFVVVLILCILGLADSFLTAPRARFASTSTRLNEKYRRIDRRERDPEFSRARKESRAKPFRTDGIRQARICSAMKEELSDIISNGDVRAVQYPPERLLRATSIMKIDISPDLSSAKIFISVLGNSVEKRQVFVWLCENMGQIRYELCQRLRHMKRVPLIVFKLADTKEVADLVALIDEISTREVAEEEEELEFEEIELD